MTEPKNYQEISVESLVPFANHPFTLYEGQRFSDMVESVRVNEILVPIIVRLHPAEDGKYEILSGHNRIAAAREVGLETVPAVVHEKMTDDEAMFIVTETNLIQRSFADMKHSERAVVIAVHYEAMKRQGYRTDLLEGLDDETYSPVANKSSMGKLGVQYGLSKDTIARYLRVNKLITPLKERLDNNEIAVRVAVTLSYLRESEQELVEKQLADGKKISIKIANTLRSESEKAELGERSVKRFFESSFYDVKIKPIKLSGKFLSEYFDEKQSPEMIEGVMAEALKQYFASKE